MKGTAAFAILLLAAVLVSALGSGPALASNEIAKKEGGTTCTVCHDKPGSRLLTDKGIYYESMGTLEGYDQVTAFAECTGCHVRKPGAKKLTANGKRFAESVKDMAGLRKWLDENHPTPQKSH